MRDSPSVEQKREPRLGPGASRLRGAPRRWKRAVVIALLTGAVSVGADERPSIDPRVRETIRRGEALVLVELRIPGGAVPEGRLSGPDAIVAQRQAIAAAQASVLSRLSGTHFSLRRRYETVPFLALGVGPDALAALESMIDVVARVRPDTTVTPQGAPRPS
jgi:hypothetical protein